MKNNVAAGGDVCIQLVVIFCETLWININLYDILAMKAMATTSLSAVTFIQLIISLYWNKVHRIISFLWLLHFEMISVRWGLVHLPRGSSWALRHKELHETRRVQKHCDRVIYKQRHTFLQTGRYKMPVLIFLIQNLYNFMIYKVLIFLMQRSTKFAYEISKFFHRTLFSVIFFPTFFLWIFCLLSVAFIVMWNETQ